MLDFDFHLRTRIIYGPDKVSSLGALAGEMGARRVLLVSDKGIVEAGHAQRGIDSLKAAGVEVTLWDGVAPNPTTECVEAGLKLAKRFEPQLLVGLGGGSSLDAAKGVNFLYSNGGRMQDYWGTGKATREMLPMIAVPTTAGTGSEMQSYALISDAQTHVKMACGDKKATCRVAILDPTLTATQPPRVTALTGIDAIAHAIETYVTRKRNSVSLAFSREAWRLLEENFSIVLREPDNLEARGAMQLGAAFAGLAIENSMLGAAHALANPLTSHFDIVHGEAVALMLPHVVRFNGASHNGWYGELLQSTSGLNGAPKASAGAAGLAEFLAELAAGSGLATHLSQVGVKHDALEQLAADAAQQWTGTFNPRQVEQRDLLQLYEAAF
ncbi:MAG: iron-containing alcohol dehydrogenase [Pirellulales bacterium]